MSVEPNKPDTTDAAEPKEGWSPAPVLLIALLAGMIFWGMTHLADNAGAFDAQVYPPYNSTNDINWPLDPAQAAAKRGRQLFEANCAACHMANGVGSPAINAPPLAGSEWVNAEGPNRMVRIVLNGLAGPITVKGQQFGAGIMLPWRDTFNDQQIADIVTYVRQNKGWGNNASAVTPEQVHAIRDKTKDRTTNWSAAELEKVPVKA
jgi:mono/diheme cytochrome c family protein